MADLTGVGQLRLNILAYCCCFSLLDMIPSLLFIITFSFLFQKYMMYIEANHPSSIEFFMIGIQVLLF